MIFLLLASHPKPASSSINKRDVNLIDLKMAFFVKKKFMRVSSKLKHLKHQNKDKYLLHVFLVSVFEIREPNSRYKTFSKAYSSQTFLSRTSKETLSSPT